MKTLMTKPRQALFCAFSSQGSTRGSGLAEPHSRQLGEQVPCHSPIWRSGGPELLSGVVRPLQWKEKSTKGINPQGRSLGPISQGLSAD